MGRSKHSGGSWVTLGKAVGETVGRILEEGKKNKPMTKEEKEAKKKKNQKKYTEKAANKMKEYKSAEEAVKKLRERGPGGRLP